MNPRVLIVSLASVCFAAAACNSTHVFDEDDGDPKVCESFVDEEGSGATTVRFVNESGTDVFLETNCGRLMYGIDAVQADGISYGYDLSCTQTCEDLMESSTLECALGACQASVIRVPAGGVYETQWNGRGVEQVDMPTGCWLDPANASTTCPQVVGAAPGNYAVSVTGYSECVPDFAGDCECDAVRGECYGTVGGASAQTVRVEFAYPTPNTIDVVFPVCTFGCAGNG